MKKFKNILSIIVLLAIFAQNITGNFQIIFADTETTNESGIDGNDILEESDFGTENEEIVAEKTADELSDSDKPEESANENSDSGKLEENEQPKESEENEIKNNSDKADSENSSEEDTENSSSSSKENTEISSEEQETQETTGTKESKTLLPFEEIEKFELNLDNVPDEILNIVNAGSYKKLDQSKQAALKAYYHVRKDTMSDCEKKGFSVKESIPLALIMQRLDISVDEAINMSVSYQSEKDALKESFDFAELRDENPELLGNEEAKEEIVNAVIEGYDSEDAVSAYPVAYAFKRDLTDVIAKDTDVVSSDETATTENAEKTEENSVSGILYKTAEILNDTVAVASENTDGNENKQSDSENADNNKQESESNAQDLKEKEIVNAESDSISEKYKVDAASLDEIISDENISADEAEEKISQAEEELGISLAAVSTADDNESLPQKAPCSYIPGMFENVDVLSGAVSYHDDIINLEGLNGLDLNLFYEYNSRRKMYMTAINGIDAIEMGGWTLNIPRMTSGCFYDIGKVPSLDKDDKSPGYIMLDDGREFKASMESIYNENGDTGYLYLDDYAYEDISWAQDAKVVYDKDHAGGRNSKYTVLYRKGIKDYFDERGLLLFREDFLGNQITFDYNNGSSSLIIKDTLNREVKVTFTSRFLQRDKANNSP